MPAPCSSTTGHGATGAKPCAGCPATSGPTDCYPTPGWPRPWSISAAPMCSTGCPDAGCSSTETSPSSTATGASGTACGRATCISCPCNLIARPDLHSAFPTSLIPAATRTPGSPASDPTNEPMNQQTETMIWDELKTRAKREGWAS